MTFRDPDGSDDSFGVPDFEIASNEARIIVTLTREDEGIDGYIEIDEGTEFDPGDTAGSPGQDVLRLAAEMVLVAAGYDEKQVVDFLNTAVRGPVQLIETED